MTSPRVSILMPNHNYGRYIAEAIDSALAQDFSDFEIILVDDCSIDDSFQIMQRYGEKDPRIRVYQNPQNLGMVGNANRCLELARGEYIKFMFTDDKFNHPQALSRLVAALDQNPNVVLAATARLGFDAEKGTANVIGRSCAEGIYRGREEIVMCLVKENNFIGEPTVTLFRRKDAQRGFSGRYWQVMDIEFWLHLLLKGDLYYIPEPLHVFRWHSQQASQVKNRANFLREESMRLFLEYAAHPEIFPLLTRRYVFFLIYQVGLEREFFAGVVEEEKQLRARFGRGWYGLYWLRLAAGAPYRRLRKWWQNMPLIRGANKVGHVIRSS